jgi:hypothetical protein
MNSQRLCGFLDQDFAGQLERRLDRGRQAERRRQERLRGGLDAERLDGRVASPSASAIGAGDFRRHDRDRRAEIAFARILNALAEGLADARREGHVGCARRSWLMAHGSCVLSRLPSAM